MRRMISKFLCHFASFLFVILRERATEESQRPFAIAQGDREIFQGDKIIFQGDKRISG
jgi:hypothetical protein